jgi:hypothetical protein
VGELICAGQETLKIIGPAVAEIVNGAVVDREQYASTASSSRAAQRRSALQRKPISERQQIAARSNEASTSFKAEAAVCDGTEATDRR